MTKVGRPSSYKPDFAEQATKLCQLGATDVDIADFFKVAVSTIYKWKHDYPTFSEALKSGKEAADERVERSLYHKAVGYTFESEKVFQFQGVIVRTPTREHVPPDTTAAIFWLKNRRADQWRDVQVKEIRSGSLDELPTDTIAAIREQLADERARRLAGSGGSEAPRKPH